ncbi:MAG: serine/threonine-protein kinase [Planctomycetaceae bacterium]
MSPNASAENGPESEKFLFELLDQYTQLLHRGTESQRQEFLNRNPAVHELAQCLNAVESLAATNRQSSQVDPQLPSPARSSNTDQPDSQPSRFGDYELIEEIGRGGMGVIFKARQIKLDRVVALKLILANRLASAEGIRRFYLEAKAAGGLKHPNIVSIHEVGEVHGQHFFAMDFIPGTTLASVLATDPPHWETSVNQLISLASAVGHLHSHRVVHRDLKPSNILIHDDGTPFLADFGLAKVDTVKGTHTQTGAIIGTPNYMSPEQAAGTPEDITGLSDIYSLGAILYEMLTGSPPFQNKHPFDTLVDVIQREPVPPRHRNRQIPAELELVCLQCLEKKPHRRYQSAVELIEDLQRVLKQEPVSTPRASWFMKITRRARRSPALLSQLGALLLVALIVQVRFLIEPVSVASHMQVMTVLGCWVLSQFVFRILSRNSVWEITVRIAWLTTDVILLTLVLYLAGAAPDPKPLGPLVVGYPLLIVSSGLFVRQRLVWFTTLMSLAAYVVLLMLLPGERQPIHYPALFMTILVLVGFIVVYQVHRLRILGRFCQPLQASESPFR